jgi:hypothetical protein
MNSLTDISKSEALTNSMYKFNCSNFDAFQANSAINILKNAKECIAFLESNYQQQSVSKTEYYKYVEFHWELSQRIFNSQEKTAKKIQKICHQLIFHGMAHKLFDQEITISFRKSNDETVKFTVYQTMLLNLISPMIKDTFNFEFKESKNKILSLDMSKEMFLKVFEMSKCHAIPDIESINNILEIYENVNYI